jgi:Catechol dioxygenase N terminus
VNLTEAEWFQAIESLTRAGHLSGDRRRLAALTAG